MPENKALGHRRSNDRLVAALDRIGEHGDARAMEEFERDAAPRAYECLAGDRVDVARESVVEEGYERGMLL